MTAPQISLTILKKVAAQGFISLHNFTTKAYALTLDINGVSIGISALP